MKIGGTTWNIARLLALSKFTIGKSLVRLLLSVKEPAQHPPTEPGMHSRLAEVRKFLNDLIRLDINLLNRHSSGACWLFFLLGAFLLWLVVVVVVVVQRSNRRRLARVFCVEERILLLVLQGLTYRG